MHRSSHVCVITFMQAILCYNSSMFYKLYRYQENFCEFASCYQFEACYKYDKEFCLKMAAEQSIGPENRTAKWDMIYDKAEHKYLTRNALLPTCTYCSCTGHTDLFCPVKKKDQSSRGHLSTQSTNHDRDVDVSPRNDDRATGRHTSRSDTEVCWR